MSTDQVMEAIRANADEFIQLRRDIHHNPELSFKEHRTSDLVAERLQGWGYQVERGLGGTGLVGQLKRGSGKRTLGLRADMDALPIKEATGLDYASRNEGVMHACGHDGHTAMLLCAAKALAETGKFSGTLNLIFQPAEEFGTDDSGAVRMMRDGLFDKYPCDAIFGMHNMPGHRQGQLLLRDGATMASSDGLTITLTGKGSHAAVPQHGIDPVVAGSSIVLGLQSIVARNVDPQAMAVITVGAFQAGHAHNVIPGEAVLKLSVRALDRKVRATLLRRIEELVEAQARAFGVGWRMERVTGYPVLVNTRAETEFARRVAIELVGAARVEPQTVALSGSEDFAFMLEQVPGSYLLIGNGDGSDDGADGGHGACMVHNPGYDFNDANLPVGAAYWALLVERFLSDAA